MSMFAIIFENIIVVIQFEMTDQKYSDSEFGFNK